MITEQQALGTVLEWLRAEYFVKSNALKILKEHNASELAIYEMQAKADAIYQLTRTLKGKDYYQLEFYAHSLLKESL